MKWVKGSLWALAGLALLLALAAAVYTTRALPTVDGELRVAGLQQPVRVERDPHGIPTIKAQNQHDLMFALGFVHAQDRLWQLETHRRIGAGRLSEAFGEAALDNDRFLRALGVRRAAAAQWARTGPQARAVVQAYTDGINSYLRNAMKARPPEFVVLGLAPEPWTPEDTLAWAIMIDHASESTGSHGCSGTPRISISGGRARAWFAMNAFTPSV